MHLLGDENSRVGPRRHAHDRFRSTLAALFFGLLCIVFAWMVRVGEAAQELVSPTLDNRGRKTRSTARTGWTLLSQAVRWGLDAF